MIAIPAISCAEELAEEDPPGVAVESNVSADEMTGSEEIIAEEDVIVTGERFEIELEPRTVLHGNELTRELGSTLGESLQNQAGVHNATFGPGVGQPVIRGMSGSRVEVLQSSMGIFDASSVSPDHAIPFEPLLAEEIEIVRGPSTFRFSGTAMGGSVDIKTGRIPEWFPKNGLDGGMEVRYDTNSNHKVGVFKANASKGPLVVHIDGFGRNSNNIKIPGNALDEDAVLEIFGNTAEFENTQGQVLNSDVESSGISLGSSLVFNQGFVGVSLNKLDNNYGIPPGGTPPHNDDPTIIAIGPENLRIDMLQTRWDAKAEVYDLFNGINSISIQAANIDYQHSEIVRGSPVTTFESLATQVRFEMEHSFAGIHEGLIGYQQSDQEFGAIGFESYIPTSDINRDSAFIIESLNFEKFEFEFGFRRETQTIKPQVDTIIPFRARPDGVVTLPDEIEHQAHSLSGAFQYDVTDKLSLRLSITESERNPAVQELLSLGPHFATRTYESGNFFLENETATNIDLGFAFRNSFFDINLNVYRNKIKDYIYLQRTIIPEQTIVVPGFGVFTIPETFPFYNINEGRVPGNCVVVSVCFPLYGYFQQDAVFNGYEADIGFLPPVIFDIDTKITLFTDYVRGYFEAEGAGDVPRLPPRRFGAIVESSWHDFDLQARWTRALAQKRPGFLETDTDGYNRFDVALSYEKSFANEQDTLFFIKGRNLTDTEIRHSTSFLRNFTPEPGRTFEAGVRWTF